MTSQYGGQDGVLGSGGGGPKFRVTSGVRRGRLRPLISRRSRLEMAEMFGKVPAPPSAAKPEKKPPIKSTETDGRQAILERGTTFTSSVVVPDTSVEDCCAPSTFQMHHLPRSMSASTSGSDLELASPPSKSSETTPHLTIILLLPTLCYRQRSQQKTLT